MWTAIFFSIKEQDHCAIIFSRSNTERQRMSTARI
jgi:hypothetical protein